MGAAWREVQDGAAFDAVLDMVEDVAALGMEVCTTLGMLTAEQAQRLKSAGLTAYNHNLDTSPEFYPTDHHHADLSGSPRHSASTCRKRDSSVCCGGIVGMGESPRDRCAMLAQLGRLDPHPESLPVNVLVRTAGTPLADADDLDPIELVRTIACARIVAPRARVRLSAGRLALSDEAQALCFVAGANSIFSGEKLLTSPNPAVDDDRAVDEPARSPISGMNARQEFEDDLAATLNELRGAGLLRQMRLPRGIDLVSNDYLGLADIPHLTEAMRAALDDIPAGSGGSRLLARSPRDLRAHRRSPGCVLRFRMPRCCSDRDTPRTSACCRRSCRPAISSCRTNAITPA